MLKKKFVKGETLKSEDLNNLVNEINNLVSLIYIVTNTTDLSTNIIEAVSNNSSLPIYYLKSASSYIKYIKNVSTYNEEDLSLSFTSKSSTELTASFVEEVGIVGKWYISGTFYYTRGKYPSVSDYIYQDQTLKVIVSTINKVNGLYKLSDLLTQSRFYYNNATHKIYYYSSDSYLTCLNSGAATENLDGIVSTTTQTFAGEKMFLAIIPSSNSLYLGDKNSAWNIHTNNIYANNVNYYISEVDVSTSQTIYISPEYKYNYVNCNYAGQVITIDAEVQTNISNTDIMYCIYNNSAADVSINITGGNQSLLTFKNMFIDQINLPSKKTLELTFTYWKDLDCVVNGGLSI